MDKSPKSRVFNEREYTCHLWSPRVGLKLGNRLGRILGPSFGGLFQNIKASTKKTEEGKEDTEVDISFGTAISTLFERINDNDMEYICETVFGYVHIEGNPVAWNSQYAGNYIEMFSVLGWALECNYGFFFGDLMKFSGIKIEKTEEPA